MTEEIPSRVKFIDRARRRIEIEMNDVTLQLHLMVTRKWIVNS
ncbi:MAG: hypothetical protein ACW985_12045 [Candidatus Thorarchaeota archaeon]